MTFLDQPHHDGSALYVSDQQPLLGGCVTVRLRVPTASASTAVWVRLVRNGEPLFVAATIEHSNEFETWWSADLHLQNPVTHYRWRLNNPDRWLTQSGCFPHDPSDATDFRLVTHSAPPDWVGDAVFYQIFPDRFARSLDAENWQKFPEWADRASWIDPVIEPVPQALTQIYGGNFAGVSEHIDHLTALGVTAIYSTPFFPGGSNHRYDAATFDHVDPLLGGDEALVQLVEDLHKSDIRFVGDLTTNHSGVGHDWFVSAQANAESEEATFYTFLEHPQAFETWLGVDTLPKFDHSSVALSQRLIEQPDSVVKRYLNPPFNFDGWRIDVANMTGRLNDQDLNHEVGRRLRKSINEVNPEAVLIAEHCHDATADLVGDSWYSTMNYAGFTNPICCWLGSWFPPGPNSGDPAVLRPQTGHDVKQTIDSFAAGVSWRARMANLTLLGSHDSVRFRSVVNNDADLHAIGVLLLMSFPGTPSVFQGDEFGLLGHHSHVTRSPIPWDGLGAKEHETFDFFRRMIAARRDNTALRRGGFRWVSAGQDHLTFLREHRDGNVLVHADRSGTTPTNELTSSLIAAGYVRADALVTDVVTADRGTLEALLFPTGSPRAAAIAL